MPCPIEAWAGRPVENVVEISDQVCKIRFKCLIVLHLTDLTPRSDAVEKAIFPAAKGPVYGPRAHPVRV